VDTKEFPTLGSIPAVKSEEQKGEKELTEAQKRKLEKKLQADQARKQKEADEQEELRKMRQRETRKRRRSVVKEAERAVHDPFRVVRETGDEDFASQV